MKNLLLLLVQLLFVQVYSQTNLEELLSSHVYYLSDDKLEGRATGSAGEALALDYISDYFSFYGLDPKGTDGYLQAFEFNLGTTLGERNFLYLDNRKVELEEEYFPMSYSGTGKIKGEIVNVGYGIHAPGLYDDFANRPSLSGKIFVINLSSPDGIHPHSAYGEYTDYLTRLKTAKAFGAKAVIFVNSDPNLDDPAFDLTRNVQEAELPVVFVKSSKAVLLKDNNTVSLSVELEKNRKVGHNVIGYINNGAENTVVIGAHYDHLGYGESGGSLYRGAPAIHNGADDNASGVALIIELARLLKEASLNNNNYMLIAFSGEELGLYGSKSYTKDPTIPLDKVNYMINFDMVGRLDEERKLALNGVGTSPVFESLVKTITTGDLTIKTTASGMGPSDHSSFYLKDIPVLHFFTGNNADYHKPTDDAYLINFEGMAAITNFTVELLRRLNEESRLAFTKTKDTDTKNTPSFKVTLGVVPDYMFDGSGMRIDGVTDGKTASKAGIQPGDVVIQMGEIAIGDMMSYMTALSKFEKGESTIVVVQRGEEELEIAVTF